MTESSYYTTIRFECPFWIALIERNIDHQYSVARIVIGTSEPSGIQLAHFLDQLDPDQLHFSNTIADECIATKRIGFKKQLHKNKQIQANYRSKHAYTKAHTMMKQLQAKTKIERNQTRRIAHEETRQLKFELKQKKKKEKNRGH